MPARRPLTVTAPRRAHPKARRVAGRNSSICFYSAVRECYDHDRDWSGDDDQDHYGDGREDYLLSLFELEHDLEVYCGD